MRKVLLLAAALLIAAAGDVPDAPTVRRYFGEPLPDLSRAELEAFERGARLFARTWEGEAGGVANATSCVACHSVPTPAGSGMADRAMVAINTDAPPGDRLEVIQRSSPHAAGAEVRRTPALYGLGYLEAVREGPDRGVLRIGAHNSDVNLRDFVSSAFATELGVATPDHCPRSIASGRYPTQCSPRMSAQQISDVVAYLRTLAPPPPPTRRTAAAETRFEDLGCARCHVPSILAPTGAGGASQRIRPFTDLRAHDVGTSARGPIRTAPLWGLNSFGPPYLHNGSAGSIEAAILAHEGEAREARDRYRTLPAAERAQLLDYLRSF